MRRVRVLPSYTVNGWTVDKCPNTFAEEFAWQVTAVDDKGFRIAKYGFSSLREALKFARDNGKE